MPRYRLAQAARLTGYVYCPYGLCRPTFTCSPYLLDSVPRAGESIAWAESNAVIFANAVFGAAHRKTSGFLDLCIALTGRAPLSGVYLEENRRPQRIVNVALLQGVDDAF